MGKRVAIFFVFILVIALAILVYFFQQGRRSLFTDPYKTIPPEACIIIETVDLQSFMNSITTEKGLFGEAGKIEELNKLVEEQRKAAQKPTMEPLKEEITIEDFEKIDMRVVKVLECEAMKKSKKPRIYQNIE